MRKRILQMISLSLMMALALTGVTSAFAEGVQAPERAARTILLYCSGHDLESPVSALMSKGLNRMMQNEIPESVNVLVLTGGAMCWNESLRLDGAEAVRADCNQVWKMTGAHDGEDGALTPAAPEGIKAVPISDIPQILGYETEYYVRDIYSNEIILPVNESTPLLRNIANAEITPDGLRYGEDLLRENTDYERHGLSDGGTVFFGTGRYTGILRAGD